MEKEMLIEKIKIFMEQSKQANCYFLIIKQFNQNRSNYSQEMQLSSAFYSFTYNALVVATFMELSKIYDSHSQSTNIQKLVNECKKNIEYYPTFQHKEKINVSGKTHELIFPFNHTIKECEKDFFKEEIKNKKTYVEMTIDRYFELYEWRLQKLEPKIKNLLKQRNKVYAHNEEATMKKSLDNLISSFPLSYEEVERLLSFAFDFCQFSYAMLTGIHSEIVPVNINDWENTLKLVKLGDEYQEIEMKKQIEDFKNNL